MAHYWFVLTKHWSLQDVQAALNVMIAILSTISIFTFARFCWQTASLRLTKHKDVPVASLLSLTSPGEVFTVLRFLRYRTLTTKRYRMFLFQATVIFALSAAAFLSGPIARFSSRRGYTITPMLVKGGLAANTYSSIVEADVEWNQTISSLDKAGFPTDQLLDFLPDSTQDWVYLAEQWNNSWKATCEYTPATSIELYGTGNYSNGNDWSTQVPALLQTIPEKFFGAFGAIGAELGRITVPKNHSNWDTLLFLFFTDQPEYDFEKKDHMSILMIAAYIQDVPSAPNNTLSFGTGPFGPSYYTRAICELHKAEAAVGEYYTAYPNIIQPSEDTTAEALENHYHDRFVRQVQNGVPVYHPTGADMFRFYQAYCVSKDTFAYFPVKRLISMRVPNVELSAVFLAVVIFDGLLIALGLLWHSFFLMRHRSNLIHMPESKLDWLLQSLNESDKVNNPSDGYEARRRSSSTVTSPRSPMKSRRESSFANAKYRFGTIGEVVWDEDVELVASPPLPQHGESEVSLVSKPETSRSISGGSFMGYEQLQPYSPLPVAGVQYAPTDYYGKGWNK